MNIKLISRDKEGELLMEGELDTQTAPEAEKIFEQMTERFDSLILDMGKLAYVSSAGLRAIKNLYLKMRAKKGKLALKNVNKNVMEVFEITGFAGMLTFIK